MNLLNYIRGMFRGTAANGELDDVRAAARQDAQTLVTTYTREFEAETARIFAASQRKLIGYDDAVDAEFEVKEDYSELDRPSLMRLAKERGIEYDKTSTKQDLIDALSN